MSDVLTSTYRIRIVFFGYVDPDKIERLVLNGICPSSKFSLAICYFTTYIVASAFFISLKFAFYSAANAAELDKIYMMKELETMKNLQPHPHVIKLLGCVTEPGVFWLCVLMMPHTFSL